jgi:hypothetical protein
MVSREAMMTQTRIETLRIKDSVTQHTILLMFFPISSDFQNQQKTSKHIQTCPTDKSD